MTFMSCAVRRQARAAGSCPALGARHCRAPALAARSPASWPRAAAAKNSLSASRSTHVAPLQALPDALQDALAAAGTPHPGLAAGTLVNTAVFIAGIRVLLKGLTAEGVANAWLLGASVYSAFGPGGYVLVCLYFIFGTLVTKLKLEQKQREGIAEARSGRRGPGSVWGSGIAGVACAWLALATGNYAPWQPGFVASFCSKLSDTVSSEVGKAYGKTTYLVTTFQRVPRGTEGAVSLEGTLAGVAAAVVFAALAAAMGQASPQGAAAVAAAAVVANLFESYLGAAVQGRVAWLTNDVVNMIQITLAAALAVGASALLQIH